LAGSKTEAAVNSLPARMGGIPGDALLLLIPMLSSMPGEYVKSTSSHRQAAFGIDDGGEVQPPPAPTARTDIHVNVNK
jgi:hypothetical protein